MNVALALLAVGFPCVLALVIAALGDRHEGFARFCDGLFPDTTHRGRL